MFGGQRAEDHRRGELDGVHAGETVSECDLTCYSLADWQNEELRPLHIKLGYRRLESGVV